jgi:protein-S-isoprenylcysteine O-methyltransferase Ste14
MIKAIVITIGSLLLLAACAFGAAGTLAWPVAWAFLGVDFLSKAVALAFADPELIRERAYPGPGVDRADTVIAALGYLGLYEGTLLVAGFDAVRFGPAVSVPEPIPAIAFLIFALGYGFATWAILCNPFFSTFVRIQQDRHHRVVSSGPYALVRHPGYAGVLLAHLVLPLALGSIWALAPAIAGIAFFVWRTSREDRTLQDRLPGYREYQAGVRWRLLPGVW